MSNYKERIEKLSSITGHSLNVNERFVVSSLQSTQSDMLAELEAKKNLLQFLNEQEEAVTAELRTQLELDATYLEELKGEVEAIQQKSKILTAYIGVIKSDEFVINKMNTEAILYNQECRSKIMPLVERSHSVRSDFNEAKGLHNKYLELVQKTNTLIAPPH